MDDYMNDIPKYRKKAKKKHTPKSDHKHTYIKVCLNYTSPKPNIYSMRLVGKVCPICGRIGTVNFPWSATEETLDSLPQWQTQDLTYATLPS